MDLLYVHEILSQASSTQIVLYEEKSYKIRIECPVKTLRRPSTLGLVLGQELLLELLLLPEVARGDHVKLITEAHAVVDGFPSPVTLYETGTSFTPLSAGNR